MGIIHEDRHCYKIRLFFWDGDMSTVIGAYRKREIQ